MITMGGLHCLTLLCCVCTVLSQRPNIIVIVADDLGWDDVGFHGSEISTPHIDELARGGVILNNYYVQPICTPTRGTLMTGRLPIHTGLQHNVIFAPEPYGLSLEETILPQYLNKLGYTSHMVGKWHLGFFRKEYTPTFRGFKSHFGYWLGHEDYFDHVADVGYSGLDFRQNMSVVRSDNGSYSTELFSAAAENLIRNHNTSEPLFLYLAHQAVHAGNGGKKTLEAPAKYVDRFPNIKNEKRRIFAGMVSALDDSVGNVTRALRESGMMENSVIIFTTDNGGPANGYDGNAACNYPLRGTKNTMWEGGVRGTAFVYSPLLQSTGYVSDHMMHVADWLPTIYKVAGGDPKELRNKDGYSMWDSLSTRGPDVRVEILHNIDPIQNFSSIRAGRYKLVMGDISYGRDDRWYGCNPPREDEVNPSLADRDTVKFTSEDEAYPSVADRDTVKFTSEDEANPSLADRDTVKSSSGDTLNLPKADSNTMTFNSDDIPIIVRCGPKPANLSTNCQPKKAPCLFDIPSDPCEYHNIADHNPAIVQFLLRRIESYRQTAVKPRNKPADPRANPALHGGVWSCWRD